MSQTSFRAFAFDAFYRAAGAEYKGSFWSVLFAVHCRARGQKEQLTVGCSRSRPPDGTYFQSANLCKYAPAAGRTVQAELLLARSARHIGDVGTLVGRCARRKLRQPACVLQSISSRQVRGTIFGTSRCRTEAALRPTGYALGTRPPVRVGVSHLSALPGNSKSVIRVSQCLVSPRVSYLAVDESLAGSRLKGSGRFNK